MTDYVVGFMFSEDKSKIALMTKNRPKWQAGKVNGLGGKVEEYDKDLSSAMAREFEEETGVKSSSNIWTEFCIIENKGLCYVHCFFAITDEVYNVKTIEDEEVAIYDTNNLPSNMIFNLNWLINMAMDDTLIFDTPIHLVEKRKVSKDYENRCNK